MFKYIDKDLINQPSRKCPKKVVLIDEKGNVTFTKVSKLLLSILGYLTAASTESYVGTERKQKMDIIFDTIEKSSLSHKSLRE
uniref:Uncharacterized protein n=1 Tax=Marseillevirus LCMAC101 TaxID=2506602 RepID=A0A481YTT9_9VIRU|nr:MAG: hypothetical protein LCMAC101_07800 [Marseillevirus LCMAC101]